MLDEQRDFVGRGGRQRGGAIRGDGEQAEEDQHVREQDAGHRDAAQNVERMYLLANGRWWRVRVQRDYGVAGVARCGVAARTTVMPCRLFLKRTRHSQ